eukprot:TRINITY_DN912_c0_g1_i1.p1 TRINITY_DN912_c0_g1~~TRINITY_DN912_c0_g1_i1.p1  ORF type:complete len:350 (+),score=43.20 TRINITY_DN912_c0_g1_i1:143-1192(+)
MDGTGINDIPNELLIIIFTFLPGKSIFISQQACKLWNSLINQSSGGKFWKILYYTRLGEPSTYAKQKEKKVRTSKLLWKQRYLTNLREKHFYFKNKEVPPRHSEVELRYAKLLWAVKYGHSKLVQKYVDKHGKELVNYKWAYPSEKDLAIWYPWFDSELQSSLIRYGDSILHVAAANGHTHVVKALIPFVNNIDHLPTDKETPFYWAARYGYVDVMILLHAANAYIDAPTGSTAGTPLERAFREGRTEAILWLLKNGASYEKASDNNICLFRNYLLALSRTIGVDDLDDCAATFFELLFQYPLTKNDVNVLTRYTRKPKTVLDLCIEYNWIKTKEVLLKYGARTANSFV